LQEIDFLAEFNYYWKKFNNNKLEFFYYKENSNFIKLKNFLFKIHNSSFRTHLKLISCKIDFQLKKIAIFKNLTVISLFQFYLASLFNTFTVPIVSKQTLKFFFKLANAQRTQIFPMARAITP
jgi:hypothetical protein